MSNRRNEEMDNYQRALFREVTEDVEKEQFLLFWKKQGRRIVIIGSAFFLVVFSVLGYVLYRDWKIEQNALVYADALNKSLYDPSHAKEVYEGLIADDSDGYALMSRIQMAALMLNQGKETEAFEELRGIGADDKLPAPFRNLSHVILAYHLLDQKDAQDEIVALMTPLVTGNTVWRGSAREILALMEFGLGNQDKAVELIEQNKVDPNLPSSFQTRAGEMLSVMN